MSKLSDRIFSAPLDLTSETLDVPEWGVKLKIQEPTAERRAELAQRFVDAAADETGIKLVELYPAMLVSCVVDPDTDEPVFSQADANLILSREGRVVERLAQACIRVSGLDETEEAGKVDSSTNPSDGGSTASPST